MGTHQLGLLDSTFTVTVWCCVCRQRIRRVPPNAATSATRADTVSAIRDDRRRPVDLLRRRGSDLAVALAILTMIALPVFTPMCTATSTWFPRKVCGSC